MRDTNFEGKKLLGYMDKIQSQPLKLGLEGVEASLHNKRKNV
jgi:hypothetical protein